MTRIANLLWACLFLSQTVGCSTLVSDISLRSSTRPDPSVRLLQRNQNARTIADVTQACSESLPPVICVQESSKAHIQESILRPAQPLNLAESCKLVSYQDADSRRKRDRAFAVASQKAIQELNDQHWKTIEGRKGQSNGDVSHSAPTVVVSDPKNVISTKSVLDLSAVANEYEQQKPAVVLFNPNLQRSPFLLITICALVLSGATWPLARRQNRCPGRLLGLPAPERQDTVEPSPGTADNNTGGLIISQNTACRSLAVAPNCLPCPIDNNWEIDLDLEQVTVVSNATKLGLPLYQKRIAHRPMHLPMRLGKSIDRPSMNGVPTSSLYFKNLPASTGCGIQSLKPIVGFVVLIHEQNGFDCNARIFTVETVVESDDGRLFAKLGSPVGSEQLRSM